MHAVNGGASAHDLQFWRQPLLFVMGHWESSVERPLYAPSVFGSIIARKPSVSRRFLKTFALEIVAPAHSERAHQLDFAIHAAFA